MQNCNQTHSPLHQQSLGSQATMTKNSNPEAMRPIETQQTLKLPSLSKLQQNPTQLASNKGLI